MSRLEAFWMRLALTVVPTAIAAAADWTHYAGDPARTSIAADAPPSLTVAWIAQASSDEEFVVNATPVVAAGRVFQMARRFDAQGGHGANRMVAFDAARGSRLWAADIAADVYSSWSSPAVDLRNANVIVGTGMTLAALAVSDGAEAWFTSLPEPVVNASPVVTTGLSSNGVHANRVLITGFSASPGAAASLCAINIDPYDGAGNPFVPGDIVWTATINGLTGASPAYADGVVFVASTSGIIRAFDASSGGLLWATPVSNQAFFGGVTVRGEFVYAASYRFTFGQNNSRLVKLRVSDGAVIWSTPCERSATVPVVCSNGLILLSGGIDDAGSAVKLQAWRDNGSTATALWDTFAASGGAAWLGGWTSQPVVSGSDVFIGVPAADAFSPFERLLRLNLTFEPGDPGFFAESAEGAGGSAAAADGALFSVGTGGLNCFRVTGRRTPSAGTVVGAVSTVGVRRW